MIITYLILLTALIVHLYFDGHKQKVHKPIKHWLSATIVFAVSCTAGWINSLIVPDVVWWQGTVYSLSLHLALFDPIWNLSEGHDLFYAGDPANPNLAWTDKIWAKVPPVGQILFRIWFILFGSGFYYHLNLILGQ